MQVWETSCINPIHYNDHYKNLICATLFYIEFSFFRNKTSKIDYLKDQWLEFSGILCGESNNNTDSVEKYSGNIFHELQLLMFPFHNPMPVECYWKESSTRTSENLGWH